MQTNYPGYFAVVGVRADGNVARQSPTTQHSAYNNENQLVPNMLLVLPTLLSPSAQHTTTAISWLRKISHYLSPL